MAETLSEFVVRRKAEIQEQMRALKAELMQLAEAERVLTLPMSAIKRPRAKVTVGGKLTLKDMALEVLRKHRPEGADANTIIELIRQDYEHEVPRSSMSPQLSRLGADGMLERNGLIWSLTERAGRPKTNEAPGVSPPDASDQGEVSWDDLLDMDPTPAVEGA